MATEIDDGSDWGCMPGKVRITLVGILRNKGLFADGRRVEQVFKLKVKFGVGRIVGRIFERGIMNGARVKKRKLSLVTVFALIEIIIIFLFGLLISVYLFVSNGTAKNRTRQIVEDSYAALTENLENDIKNISRAGFSLMNSDTVIRLKAYYYD